MSNCNFEALRGFEDRIIVGAEVVNGTGEVRVEFYQATDDFSGVHHTLTPEQALDLARLLSQQAHEAMRAKWNEENL